MTVYCGPMHGGQVFAVLGILTAAVVAGALIGYALGRSR